jgi:hypothetical protein
VITGGSGSTDEEIRRLEERTQQIEERDNHEDDA